MSSERRTRTESLETARAQLEEQGMVPYGVYLDHAGNKCALGMLQFPPRKPNGRRVSSPGNGAIEMLWSVGIPNVVNDNEGLPGVLALYDKAIVKSIALDRA